MSLLIKDIQLLKKYNKTWEKIETLMKIDFNTKTTYGDDDQNLTVIVIVIVIFISKNKFEEFNKF